MTLRRAHLWRPGTSGGAGPPLLLLHGTGGDEHSLAHLQLLAPGAPMLSVRGTVQENGLNRFFRRLSEGVLDEADLTARTHELASFLHEASREYGLAERWLAVGFSNGANIASALLLHHPELLAGVVAIAAMAPFRQVPAGLPLGVRRALVVNGVADPLVSEEVTAKLVAQLTAVGATVEVLRHPGGHVVPEELLPAVAAFVAGARLP